MRYLLLIILLFFCLIITSFDFYSIIAVLLSLFFFYEFLLNSNNRIAFKEFLVCLYSFNYLLAPVFTFHLPQDLINYPIKLTSNEYFSLIIPAMLLFYLGLNTIKTTLFEFKKIDLEIITILNEPILKKMVYIGILLNLLSSSFSGEISFFIYLLSMLRFVGAFSLFYINKEKFIIFIASVILLEMLNASLSGMYHDFLIWGIFLGLIFFYTVKPKMLNKLLFISFALFFILFIQSLKTIYRNNVWFGNQESNISSVISSSQDAINVANINSESNYLGTLNRVNQAWIFASTVDNLKTSNNFQGIQHFYQYFESALLPRFLAPNKLESGNKDLFNKFSGHQISSGTSMGLGIFADGYIAFGKWGLWITAFIFGLVFVGIFEMVEFWSKISPFFIFFLFPILFYAVRPDCELQTIFGHIVKSTLVYGLLVIFLRKYFKKQIEFIKFNNQINLKT
jgi:hypothetical protein